MRKILSQVITILFSILPILSFPIFSASSNLLSIGSKAPDFTLYSSSGDKIALSNFTGKKVVVLVFYPGDNTPVCTKQLCELRDSYEKLTEMGVEVLGINPADSASHAKFSAKNSYSFPLLVDTEKKVAKQYGRSGGLFGVKRAVFVIDKEGKIIFFQKGKPPVKDIISAIKDNMEKN